MLEDIAEAALADEVFDIAPVSGAFRDDDIGCPLALAKLDDCGHDARIGVDHLVAMPFDEIRLQNDAFPFERHGGAEMLVLRLQDTGEVGVVGWRFRDVDSRVRWRRAKHADARENEPAIPAADTVKDGRLTFDHDRAELFVRGGGGNAEKVPLLDAERENHQGLTITVWLEPARLSTLFFGGLDVPIDSGEGIANVGQIAIQIERQLPPTQMFDVIGVELLDQVLNGSGNTGVHRSPLALRERGWV